MPNTHEVSNQAPLLAGYNAWSDDPWLRSVVEQAGAGWIGEQAARLGEFVGSERQQQLADQANRYAPVLRTHDRFGHRIDLAEYHRAYHELMQTAFGAGCAGLAWTAPNAGRFSARAALNYVWNQGEQGVSCPVTMTFAGVQVVRGEPALARDWVPKLTAFDYDPRPLPVTAKRAATIGMAMTEKQGGSDLRATQTSAALAGDGLHALTGHKWFCSAPMSDGFLTLARLDAGVTCFLVPRSLPDGTRNRFFVQRLKDKLGNRSNASAEIEYDDTLAHRIGEPGRGIATLIEMAHLTRFDIVIACAGMMRTMLNQALHHCAHRSAFGRRLNEQPLMQNVLADLALETEAALHLAFRLARAFDAQDRDEHEHHIARILTPIAKFWLCARMPALALEAMQCLGGNSYVEEGPLARWYREAPLNGIWEGSGNVICLDVLRSIQKEPATIAALGDDVLAVRDSPLTAHWRATMDLLGDPPNIEHHARRIVGRLALAASAAYMRRSADSAAAEAYGWTRLAPDTPLFGALPTGTPVASLAERARISKSP